MSKYNNAARRVKFKFGSVTLYRNFIQYLCTAEFPLQIPFVVNLFHDIERTRVDTDVYSNNSKS